MVEWDLQGEEVRQLTAGWREAGLPEPAASTLAWYAAAYAAFRWAMQDVCGVGGRGIQGGQAPGEAGGYYEQVLSRTLREHDGPDQPSPSGNSTRPVLLTASTQGP